MDATLPGMSTDSVGMRNYLYISDAKVDAYLPQIAAPEKERFAGKLGFNVGILQGSYESEQMPLENRIGRLRTVEEKLREVKSIGPIDGDKPWISGSAEAVAAGFPEKEEMMFFFSSAPSYFLGLAGSAHHIIGNERPETAHSAISHLPSLISNLKTIYSGRFVSVVDGSDEKLEGMVHLGVSQTPGDVSSWTRILASISTQFDHLPSQTISFLARRLTSMPTPGGDTRSPPSSTSQRRRSSKGPNLPGDYRGREGLRFPIPVGARALAPPSDRAWRQGSTGGVGRQAAGGRAGAAADRRDDRPRPGL